MMANLGEPKRIVVWSDGTISAENKALLLRLSANLQVIEVGWLMIHNIPRLPASVRSYASTKPLGKKLAGLVSLDVDSPTIYADSDILFFPGAWRLRNLIGGRDRGPWYLRDNFAALDSRLGNGLGKLDPVNSGFLVFFDRLPWLDVIRDLDRLVREPEHFTEQTVVHALMHTVGAHPLPAVHYVMSCSDIHVPWDHYASADIVLRHYVSRIRWKMWMQVAGGMTGTLSALAGKRSWV